MIIEHSNNPNFPIHFWRIIIKSFRTYLNSFSSYLLLAILTYIPFVVFDQFSKLDLLDIIEFFHGNFLDIVIFLTLPTLFTHKKVFPFATITLFMQRFFTSAVIISFVQLGTLLFFMMFFAQISLGVIIVGIIPYILLLFAGFFLIMENSAKLVSIKYNLINSIKLVKSQFFSIFWNYINITILMIIPLFLFSVWYLGQHSGLAIFAESVGKNAAVQPATGEKLLMLIQDIVQESGFKWGRIGIHIIFRPIKSLFLSFLFLGIIQQFSPNSIRSFLGDNKADDSSHHTHSDTATESITDDN